MKVCRNRLDNFKIRHKNGVFNGYTYYNTGQ